MPRLLKFSPDILSPHPAILAAYVLWAEAASTDGGQDIGNWSQKLTVWLPEKQTAPGLAQ